MRYVAQTTLEHCPQGTEDRCVYRPGDPIEDFQAWPAHAQRSLLALGHVACEFDPGAWVAKTDLDGLRRAIAEIEAGRPPAQKNPPPAPEVPPAPIEPEDEDQTPPEDRQANAATDVPCPLCVRRFASARALQTHRSKMHGGL